MAQCKDESKEPGVCCCGDSEEGFAGLFKYTISGYIGGLFAGFILDKFGFATSAVGQWFVRTLSGESESIFEGIFAIRRRFSKAPGSLSEAYGWGKLIGMCFPWIIDFFSRSMGINVNGVEGFYIPYFYALGDQIGANVSGLIYLQKKHGGLTDALRAYVRNPVMVSSFLIIFLVPIALFFARFAGFSPSSQVLTAVETIAANLCWVPPLLGRIVEKKEYELK